MPENKIEKMNPRIEIDPSGILRWKEREYKCALGKGGIKQDKIEGDGATPAGEFPLRAVFYRLDKLPELKTGLEKRILEESDGWCDEPTDPNYNKLVKLPYPSSAENLWRNDDLYDIIVVVGYNDNPPVQGKGSAIFMHVARENYSPTAGCVALSKTDLLEVLKDINEETTIRIQNDPRNKTAAV